jgi:hypothetical protein
MIARRALVLAGATALLAGAAFGGKSRAHETASRSLTNSERDRRGNHHRPQRARLQSCRRRHSL